MTSTTNDIRRGDGYALEPLWIDARLKGLAILTRGMQNRAFGASKSNRATGLSSAELMS